MTAVSRGLRASNSSTTRGRPRVMSFVFLGHRVQRPRNEESPDILSSPKQNKGDDRSTVAPEPAEPLKSGATKVAPHVCRAEVPRYVGPLTNPQSAIGNRVNPQSPIRNQQFTITRSRPS
jgi:hypothetical protein